MDRWLTNHSVVDSARHMRILMSCAESSSDSPVALPPALPPSPPATFLFPPLADLGVTDCPTLPFARGVLARGSSTSASVSASVFPCPVFPPSRGSVAFVVATGEALALGVGSWPGTSSGSGCFAAAASQSLQNQSPSGIFCSRQLRNFSATFSVQTRRRARRTAKGGSQHSL